MCVSDCAKGCMLGLNLYMYCRLKIKIVPSAAMGIWSLFVILLGVGVATKWICLWVNFMATLQLREIMKKVLRVGHVK